MKIKITKEIKELDGTITEKVATPFGNSAHLNVGKAHTGKVMSYIAPTNPEYEWILSVDELKRVIKSCTKTLKEDTGKLKHLKKGYVKKLKGRFTLGDLNKVVNILEKDKTNKPLIKSIKSTYGL